MLSDFHIHSTYSDGTQNPDEICDTAINRGIKAIAIVDHNTLDGYKNIGEKYRNHLEIIKGVEIDCKFQHINSRQHHIHLIAYNIMETEQLERIMEENKKILRKMGDNLIKKLIKKHAVIDWDEYKEYKHPRERGGWEAINYLYDKGIINRLWDGRKLYPDNGIFYTDYAFPDCYDVIEAIHNAKGQAIVGHIWKSIMTTYLTPSISIEKEIFLVLKAFTLLKKDKIYRIDGIECYHPTHDNNVSKRLFDFCVEKNLIITGGSDSHGEFNKNIDENINYEIGISIMETEGISEKYLLKKRR